jgi:ATP-dependent protease ClpP protease subunit
MPTDEILLQAPNVRIYGPIESKTVWDVFDQIAKAKSGDGALVVEVNTEGGDADAARRIALEIKLFRRATTRPTHFLGKTIVYSAGVTIMAAFAKADRFLTADAVLLIHERRLDKTLELKGPIRADLQIVREQLAMLETAEKLERDGFAELIEGSNLTEEELYKRATSNCYLTAQESLELGLIGGIVAVK